jgi:hypothetical protein
LIFGGDQQPLIAAMTCGYRVQGRLHEAGRCADPMIKGATAENRSHPPVP